MKRFIKNDNIQYLKDIVLDIEIDGVKYNIYNPSEEDVLSHGWSEFVDAELSNNSLLDIAKASKISEIKSYDTSEDVNLFYIKDIPCWIDKNTRVGLMLRFDSEKAVGNTETSLWYNDYKFTLSLDDAKNMLYELEVYASKCYDNTQNHISIVKKIDDIDDVNNYDYTLGYPEKLHF